MGRFFRRTRTAFTFFNLDSQAQMMGGVDNFLSRRVHR
jgi:hypothetical protein